MTSPRSFLMLWILSHDAIPRYNGALHAFIRAVSPLAQTCCALRCEQEVFPVVFRAKSCEILQQMPSTLVVHDFPVVGLGENERLDPSSGLGRDFRSTVLH